MLRSLLTLILASALEACLESGNLKTPTLSINPTRSAVSPGENIQFICTTSNSRCGENAEFQLFKNRKLFHRSISSGNFSLTVNVSHQDQYSCEYSYRNDTVTVNSSRSNAIDIIVVNLQQASIFLRDPDRLTDSQGQVVIRGHSFTITCYSESQYSGGSFSLSKGSNIIRSQSAVNHSALFSFPEADYSHQGNYSCVYEVNVSSRTFSSSASYRLLITVKASLHPIIAAVVSAVLLLFAVLTIILLVKKRQKTVKVHFFSQGAVNMHSNMVDTKRYEEDDEDDYVNTRCADEEDYVNVNIVKSDASSDDSGSDYVNVQRTTVDFAKNRY